MFRQRGLPADDKGKICAKYLKVELVELGLRCVSLSEGRAKLHLQVSRKCCPKSPIRSWPVACNCTVHTAIPVQFYILKADASYCIHGFLK